MRKDVKCMTYLDKFYEGGDLADIMEADYNQNNLDNMTEEEASWLDIHEGDWDSISLHSNSKFWRR